MSSFSIIIQKAKPRAPTRLEVLSDKMAGQVSVSLSQGIKRFKKRIPKEKLAEAIETGSIGHIVKEIPWYDNINDLVPGFKKISQSFDSASLISFEALPAPIKRNLRIDLKNPALKRFIDERFNKYLQDLSEESVKIVQRQIQRSFSHAQAPRDMADEIVNHIGLNWKQSTALTNYQMGLREKKLPESRVKILVKEYEERLLDQRAVMIARTEIQNANNQGQLSVWQAAQNEGLLDSETTYKVWKTDRTPCELCLSMKDKKVKLNESWKLPDGRLAEVPSDSHPFCYCFSILEF